jgi:nitrite reductase/ring-hydroxylating ferredoxin subunit
VVCPWHYGKFDLRTGKAIDGVVKKAVERYDVRIHHDIVQIRLPIDSEIAV